MLVVLTVCSGNICRSPLASQLLSARLADLEGRIRFASVGTVARDGDPMHPQAAAWSRYLGGDPAPHRSTYLLAPRVRGADLVLGMAREHRRAVVTEVPALTRQSFTLRELARLAACVTDVELTQVLAPAGSEPARLRAVLQLLASSRGRPAPASDPGEDDVVDPIGQPPAVFERAARQVDDAIGQVERVLRAALRA